MGCRTFDVDDRYYKYVVVFSKYNDKLLLSRHKERTTWETQGGHIEQGETPEQAAARELWEESGAEKFKIEKICAYRAGDDVDFADGVVFFAEISQLGKMPDSEMAEVKTFDTLPNNITYPEITPVLFEQVKDKFKNSTRTEN